jgi:prepilin-type N-terminal cleavage/methylation domain-containing protein
LLHSRRPRVSDSGRRVVVRRRPACLRYAFTVVELMVVVAIIALVLAIGIPAFNSMTEQTRLSKTRQLLNGTLVRARIISVSDRTLTAVRLCPAEWEVREGDERRTLAGRQIMTTYSYRATTAANPSNPAEVSFHERFERLQDGPTQVLPPDTWVAPSEALDMVHLVDGDETSNWVLNGTIHHLEGGQLRGFELDGDSETNPGEELLDADDFLIVFDPDTGVKPSLLREPWPIKAYVPEEADVGGVEGTEAAGEGWNVSRARFDTPFQRFNFTGVVVYKREPFVALGFDAASEAEYRARRDVLRRFGLMYYVDRTGGNLLAGGAESTE